MKVRPVSVQAISGENSKINLYIQDYEDFIQDDLTALCDIDISGRDIEG